MTQKKLTLKEKLAGWIFWHIVGSVPSSDIIDNALDNYPDEIDECMREMYN